MEGAGLFCGRRETKSTDEYEANLPHAKGRWNTRQTSCEQTPLRREKLSAATAALVWLKLVYEGTTGFACQQRIHRVGAAVVIVSVVFGRV